MRFRLMASYFGVRFEVGLGPDGTEATLFAASPPPTELGFAAAPGHWRKQVSITDLDALWQARPIGDYRGEPCLVLADLGDRLHIAYLGRDAARATQLGYWEIDREVFEVVAARHDVMNLVEERVDFPLAAATFPSSSGGPTGEGHDVDDFWGGSGLDKWDESGHPAGFGGGSTDGAARAPDRIAAWHGSPPPEPWPGSWPGSETGTGSEGPAEGEPRTEGGTPTGRGTGTGRGTRSGHEIWPGRQSCPEPGAAAPAGRRTGQRDRISPESVFAELLALSAIPQASYAVDKEVPGAMCLVQADGGFEVFSRTEDARLEVRFFEDEEAAYFYLFGVLAAEAVRSGRLTPGWPGANGHSNSSAAPGISPAATQNVSKYLRRRKLPKPPSRPARVYLAGGADGPPLPKQPRRPPRTSTSQKHRAYHKTVVVPLTASRALISLQACGCFSRR